MAKSDKSYDEQIADLEKQIADLKAERDAKAKVEYPKHLTIKLPEGERGGLRDADGDGYYVVEVNSAEEEKAALKGGGTVVPDDAVTGTKGEEAGDKPKAKKGKK